MQRCRASAYSLIADGASGCAERFASRGLFKHGNYPSLRVVRHGIQATIGPSNAALLLASAWRTSIERTRRNRDGSSRKEGFAGHSALLPRTMGAWSIVTLQP
jgi:hypothetical protein